MKNKLLIGLCLSLLTGCTEGGGFQGCVIPRRIDLPLMEVGRAFRTQYPEFGFKEVKETAIPGLFEIDTEETTLFYHPASGHLLAGTLYSPEEPFSAAPDFLKEEESSSL